MEPGEEEYEALREWLVQHERRPFIVAFEDIERVIGTPLPAACRRDAAQWQSYDDSGIARAIMDAGWRVRDLQLVAGTVGFRPRLESGG